MEIFMKYSLHTFFLLLLVAKTTQSYVVGHTRLRDPQSGRSVDVLYDRHVIEKSLEKKDLDTLSYQEIKQRIYATEKVFLEALENISNADQASAVAIVGESKGEEIHAIFGIFPFIALLGNLVPKQFNDIAYRHGDRARWDYADWVIEVCNGINSFKEDYDLFCKDILPLSDDLMNDITINSGEKATQAFSELYHSTLGELHTMFDYFVKMQMAGKPRKEHANLADVEMLLHILSAQEPHIIVYTGAYHGKGIVNFLKEKLHYQVVCDHHAKEYDYRDIEMMFKMLNEQGECFSPELAQEELSSLDSLATRIEEPEASS